MKEHVVNKAFSEINAKIKTGGAVVLTTEEIIDLVRKGDPLNKVRPGEFNYGGAHVIEDLLLGKKVRLKAESYGTDCYPRLEAERIVTLKTLPQATLCNPRNCYQNCNCAVNLTDRTLYTYMGVLKPEAGNATYCSAGQLSPLLNDPYYMTIGLGTRIFLGGGAGTLWLMGDLKQMSPDWIKALNIVGYGVSLAVGVGVLIPLLNEEIAAFTAISDEDILAPIVDYGGAYPQGKAKPLAHVSYAQLRSGSIQFKGKTIPTAPLFSMVKAREIAEILKGHIKDGKFLLGEPQMYFPGRPA